MKPGMKRKAERDPTYESVLGKLRKEARDMKEREERKAQDRAALSVLRSAKDFVRQAGFAVEHLQIRGRDGRLYTVGQRKEDE